FEVGLLDADWKARWISPAEGRDPGYGKRPAHALGASFHVSGPVRTARLSTTALGVYEAFVSGERAGTARLSPGSSSYGQTLYAQVGNVTYAGHEGDHQLSNI